jgi:hypothetical protein
LENKEKKVGLLFSLFSVFSSLFKLSCCKSGSRLMGRRRLKRNRRPQNVSFSSQFSRPKSRPANDEARTYINTWYTKAIRHLDRRKTTKHSVREGQTEKNVRKNHGTVKWGRVSQITAWSFFHEKSRMSKNILPYVWVVRSRELQARFLRYVRVVCCC